MFEFLREVVPLECCGEYDPATDTLGKFIRKLTDDQKIIEAFDAYPMTEEYDLESKVPAPQFRLASRDGIVDFSTDVWGNPNFVACRTIYIGNLAIPWVVDLNSDRWPRHGSIEWTEVYDIELPSDEFLNEICWFSNSFEDCVRDYVKQGDEAAFAHNCGPDDVQALENLFQKIRATQIDP